MRAVAEQPKLWNLQPRRAVGLKEAALMCGAASFLVYVALDALAAYLYGGYSYADQTISELSAVGAPTRSLWLPLGALYSALVVAFGVGLWISAIRNRLRVIAVLVLALGFLGLVAWPLAPMHQREVLAAGGGDWKDMMHLSLGFVDVVLFVGSMALGATLLGGRFRAYTILSIAVVLVFGLLTSINSPGVQHNEPTPWLGLYERVAVFGSMQWLAVLGLTLLTSAGDSDGHADNGAS